MTAFDVKTVQTTSFQDQKPGTSGLRKKTKVFAQPHYTANFVQATLDAIPGATGKVNATLVVGGDGRYYSKDAVQIIIRVASANKVSKLIIGRNGILSTPAASNLIRKRKATGGILLTASHNPGGPDNDFGIKYNISNGGPAPEQVTEKIFSISKTLKEYHERDIPEVDLSSLGTKTFGDFSVEIVDPVTDYVSMVKEIFDFEKIKKFFSKTPEYRILFDGMHGVTGPYAAQIFVEELGLPKDSVMNCVPSPDFNGGHPDPNLTYAHELVERVDRESINFGAASDGDGDRNMIIGKGCFVNPSDSVAVIAAQSQCIPYFQRSGLNGLARSMPTSKALDRVAEKLNVKFFEVPTGWKFFGNLMDAGQLSVCGEESFGTGSDHIREKDGLWAIIAWLNIVAAANESTSGVGLNDILQNHYATYGRNFFSRYDYEEVDSDKAAKVFHTLEGLIGDEKFIHSEVSSTNGERYLVDTCDNFKYTDPIDGSVSSKQGIRVLFNDGSRIIYRLSGTGSSGATIRVYIEKYTEDPNLYKSDAAQGLQGLVEIALRLSQLVEHTGRKEPTVKT